jgi:hypothetical protein
MNRSLDWGRVSKGLTLMGLGGFLLATTIGALDWSFWLDAAAFWPVLIVALGVRVIFERSPAPWGVLLSPVLILGTLGWVAHGAPAEVPVGEWIARSAAKPKGAESFTFEANLFRSRLDVQARQLGDDVLVNGRSGSRHDPGRIDVRGDSPDPKVRIDSKITHGWSLVSGPKQRWELGLADSLPVRFEVHGAMNRGRADLARGHLSGARVDGAFNDFELRLPRPERPTRVRADGVFNNLRVIVPAGTAVTVSSDAPFNVIDAGPAQRKKGPPEGVGYEVRIEGVFNHLSVEDEAPAATGGAR